MLYGPFRITQTTIKPDFPSCWAIFSHLPPIAKQRGTAVESIAFHQVCSVNVTEKQVVSYHYNVYSRFVNQKVKNLDQIKQEPVRQYLTQIFLDNQYLRTIQNRNSNIFVNCVPGLPVKSALKQMLFSVHFGTAAIHSFDEAEIDINEAMIWAFNAVHDMDAIDNELLGCRLKAAL